MSERKREPSGIEERPSVSAALEKLDMRSASSDIWNISRDPKKSVDTNGVCFTEHLVVWLANATFDLKTIEQALQIVCEDVLAGAMGLSGMELPTKPAATVPCFLSKSLLTSVCASPEVISESTSKSESSPVPLQ